MARDYPRNYLVVRDGEVEKVVVSDPVHETAIILKHPEATGTNRPEPFDDSRFVIEDEGTEGSYHHA